MIAKLGKLIGILVLAFFIKVSAGEIVSLYNKWAIIFILGGSLLCLSIIDNPVRFFGILIAAYRDGKFNSKKFNHSMIDKLIKYSKSFYSHSEETKVGIFHEKHYFLKIALSKVKDGLQTPEEIEMILTKKAQFLYEKRQRNIDLAYSFIKYPPLIGIVGTIIGLISYINHNTALNEYLGSPGEIIEFTILVALYSFILSYIILMPVVERAERLNQMEFFTNRMIIEGTVLISKRMNPIIVREILSSYKIGFIPDSSEGGSDGKILEV